MTQAEWLATTNPVRLVQTWGRRLSDRRLRLFGVACCRRIPHLLPDDRSLRAVEVGELYAEGRATADDCHEAYRQADAAQFELWQALGGPFDAPFPVAWLATLLAKWTATIPLDANIWSRDHFDFGPQNATFSALFRDVAGNPFRRVVLNPHWLAWNDATVPKLAAAIYEARAFDRLPILADALEEAGCGSAAVLSHCRGKGPHVHGCWVLDRLLGKD